MKAEGIQFHLRPFTVENVSNFLYFLYRESDKLILYLKEVSLLLGGHFSLALSDQKKIKHPIKV